MSVKPMTPREFQHIRKVLGVSRRELAELICVHDQSTIRRWEEGEREIGGPLTVLLRLLLKHHNLENGLD